MPRLLIVASRSSPSDDESADPPRASRRRSASRSGRTGRVRSRHDGHRGPGRRDAAQAGTTADAQPGRRHVQSRHAPAWRHCIASRRTGPDPVRPSDRWASGRPQSPRAVRTGSRPCGHCVPRPSAATVTRSPPRVSAQPGRRTDPRRADPVAWRPTWLESAGRRRLPLRPNQGPGPGPAVSNKCLTDRHMSTILARICTVRPQSIKLNHHRRSSRGCSRRDLRARRRTEKRIAVSPLATPRQMKGPRRTT